jgi:hypothetical protein
MPAAYRSMPAKGRSPSFADRCELSGVNALVRDLKERNIRAEVIDRIDVYRDRLRVRLRSRESRGTNKPAEGVEPTDDRLLSIPWQKPPSPKRLVRQERDFWMRRRSHRNRRQRQHTPAETKRSRNRCRKSPQNGLSETGGKIPSLVGPGGGGCSRAKPVSANFSPVIPCYLGFSGEKIPRLLPQVTARRWFLVAICQLRSDTRDWRNQREYGL